MPRISNMISQHYRYRIQHLIQSAYKWLKYNTTAEDTCLSTDYNQMPTGKEKNIDPRFFSRARGLYVSDRRGSAVPPIRVKLRTARSACRAGGVHLALEPFRKHFLARYKISRLIIKRGFSFRWLRLVSCGFATVIGRNQVSQRS